MNNHSLKIILVLGFVLSLSLSSCVWEEHRLSTHPIENVSFSTDVLPIMNKNCMSIGCHNETGVSPKLTPEAARKVLIESKMIDISKPENSKFYQRMNDKECPMQKDNELTPRDSKTVLIWIAEGAKDN